MKLPAATPVRNPVEPKGSTVTPVEAEWHPRNALLARLPHAVCARLQPKLQLVQLRRGEVLFQRDTHPTLDAQVYFPRSALVSLAHVLSNGDTGEVAMVGNEGVVGMSLAVDSTSTPSCAIVQVEGEAWAMDAHEMGREFKLADEFQVQVLRHTQFLLSQMAQITMCSRRHLVEKQVCRWLLSACDRVGTDELSITHEAIADALGVRREGVTQALGRMQELGHIACARMLVRILDRPALEAIVCECYEVIREGYRRLSAPAE